MGYLSATAQVGIGNTNPHAQLDISASDSATPSITDGILIPRIDQFPATNPGTDQDGMLIFVTGNGTPIKGFYYWDNGATSWVSVRGAKRIDELIDGKTNTLHTSVFLGENSGANNTNSGSYNTALGYNSLNANTTGDFNIAIGSETLMFNTTARGNIAIGSSSLQYNSSGEYNTAIGLSTLTGNTSGSNNTAIGNDAMDNNSSGSFNTAIGERTLFFNDDGNYNTAIGTDALLNNSTADNNTATGYNTLYSNTIGFGNTANGKDALESNTTGYYNTALGYSALQSNTIGNFNTANGKDALESNIIGNNNTAFGFEAGHNNNAHNNIFIGYQAGYNEVGSDKLFIENSSADANNALIYGEFDANILRTNGEFQIGNPSGSGFAFPTADGTSGQVLTTDGSGNITFQDSTIDSDWHAEGTTSSPNDITDNIFTQGNVGIGNTAPNSSLDIAYSGAQENGVNIDYSHTNAGSGGLGLNILAESGDSGSIIGSAITIQNSNLSNFTNGIAVTNTANGNNNQGISSQVSGNANNNTGISGIASGASDENIGGFFVASSSGIVNTGILARATGATNNWAGFFGQVGLNGSGNVFISDLLEVDGAFRYTDGNEATGYVLRTDANGDANWANPNTIFTDTQNTLDEAYDEGGAGAGRIITATDGPVEINGEDGFEITGTYGSGDNITNGNNSRLYYNPRKAAFRAGYVSGAQWNNPNVGIYSFAAGNSVSANGEASFSGGSFATASGRYSTSFGRFTEAFSYAEMAIGSYPTEYTPVSATALDLADRAFVIGNSTIATSRSNAFEIWKDGRVIINENYTLPTVDGTSNQVLTTDGSGNVSWQDGSTNTLALARITMSSSQTFLGLNDDVKINFDTVDYDLNSNFNTTTNRFVATTAGYYRISGSYHGSTSSPLAFFSFDIAVNGTYVRRSNSDNDAYGSINSVVYLNINDYVELNFSHGAGITIFSFPQLTYFEIEQIR